MDDGSEPPWDGVVEAVATKASYQGRAVFGPLEWTTEVWLTPSPVMRRELETADESVDKDHSGGAEKVIEDIDPSTDKY